MSRLLRGLPARLLGAALIGFLIGSCGSAPSDPAIKPTPTAAAVQLPVVEPATVQPAPQPAPEGALPPVEPATVSGDIIVAGSSTVFPLTERMAELFTDDGYSGQITIDSIGTGAGFERFCVARESDIANASRPIKDEEQVACIANGRTPLEFRVGSDALAIVVSQENSFLEGLSLAQLAEIYSGTAKTWADLDPGFPAEPIRLFSPGTDSGTFEYFVEAVFDKDAAPMLAANPQLSEDDNVLVQGIEGSPYAIGYFGYAYYLANSDSLKLLMIEGIEPSERTAEDGSYPLARPLFVYSAREVLAAKPQVTAFLNYYLAFVNDEILDVGYFPASPSALQTARERWLGVQ
jgi:phosphate transport system substrate-binding protein